MYQDYSTLLAFGHQYVSEKVVGSPVRVTLGRSRDAVVVEEPYGGFDCCLVLIGGRKVLCSY